MMQVIRKYVLSTLAFVYWISGIIQITLDNYEAFCFKSPIDFVLNLENSCVGDDSWVKL